MIFIQNLVKNNSKKFFYCLGISCFKRIQKEPTFLQIIAPFLGIYCFLSSCNKKRILHTPYFLLLLMVFINLINFISSHSINHLLRLGQLSGFILLGFVLINKLTLKNISKFTLSIELLSIFSAVVQVFSSQVLWKREFFHVTFERLGGVVGEPNFSAALMFGVLTLNLVNKNYKRSLLDIILITSTLSRTVIFTLVVFLIIYSVVDKFNRTVLNKITTTLLFLLLISPFAIWKSNNYLSIQSRIIINELTARRYLITSAHLDRKGESLLGEGYFQFDKRIRPETMSPHIFELYEKWNSKEKVKEQHSILVQVITDFGILGYILFSLFILSINNKSKNMSGVVQLSWPCLILIFSSINGLNEVILYIWSSFILHLEINNLRQTPHAEGFSVSTKGYPSLSPKGNSP